MDFANSDSKNHVGEECVELSKKQKSGNKQYEENEGRKKVYEGTERVKDDENDVNEDLTREIEISFFTQLENLEYQTDETPYMIDVNTTPLQLSQLLNEILCLSIPKTFNFLIDEKILTQPINEYLRNSNRTSECRLQIEYFLAMNSPIYDRIFFFDEWISSIAVTKQSSIVSGWMDGIWRLCAQHQNVSEPILSFKQSDVAITCLTTTNNRKLCASMDNESEVENEERKVVKEVAEEIKVWIGLKSGDVETSITNLEKKKTKKKERGIGHNDSVNCICVSADEEIVCTGSFDTQVLLWQNKGICDDWNENEKAKGNKRHREIADTMQFKQKLSKHTLSVTDVCFMSDINNCFILSCSLDNSIIAWDTITASPFVTWITNNASTTMSTIGNCVCTGHEDGKVRLWDIRSGESTAEISSNNLSKIYALHSSSPLILNQHYRCHTRMVSCVRWNVHNNFQIASASSDGLIQILDTRAYKLPLQTVELSSNNVKTKIMACEWLSEKIIVSGGSDGTLHKHSLSYG